MRHKMRLMRENELVMRRKRAVIREKQVPMSQNYTLMRQPAKTPKSAPPRTKPDK